MSFRTVTRFGERRISDGELLDGPVSGALQAIFVNVGDMATSSSVKQSIRLPAGVSFKITDVTFDASAVANNPQIQIGTAHNGTQLVAGVTLTTNFSATLKTANTQLSEAGLISVRVATDTDDTITAGGITIFGHVTAPPDSLAD